ASAARYSAPRGESARPGRQKNIATVVQRASRTDELLDHLVTPLSARAAALEALYQRYKDQGLVVLGINMKEAPDLVKTYVTKHRLTFPHLLDTDAKVAAMFAVPGTPTTLLIDREGQVLGGGLGYRDWASPAAQRLVESLLQTAQ